MTSVSYKAVFQNSSFRKLWVGQSISQFGDGFYWLSIVLSVSALTHQDVRAIGLVSMAFLVPQLPIGVFGSPLVDRVNRRHLMIVADVLRIFTTLGCIFAYHLGSPVPFYAIALVQSSITGFFVPAKNALITQIVDRDALLPANTLSQTTQVAALIFGPALAGFVIEHLGIPVAFFIDALTFLISAIFVWWIDPVPTPATPSRSWRQAWLDLREGLVFIRRTPIVRNVIWVVSVLFLGLGTINVLWVPYMQRVFHVGAQEIGLVDAAQGVGMLVGTLAMGHGWLRTRPPHALLLGGLFIISLGFIGTGVAPSYTFILLITGILGTAIPAAQASFMTLVQQVTPQRLMGRVNGSVGAVTNGAMLISMALAASLAEQIGLRQSYVLSGTLGLLAVVLGMRVLQSPTSLERTE